MSKNILNFAGAFLLGALIALAVRTARHDPYSSPPPEIPAETVPAHDIKAHEHGEAAPLADAKPVNQVCAICGMDVDPNVATMNYKGKVIGFGCKNCLPKFAAEPDLYGPAALENRVVE